MTIENATELSLPLNRERTSTSRKAALSSALALALALSPSFAAAQTSQTGTATHPSIASGSAASQTGTAETKLPGWDVVSVKPGQGCESGAGGIQYLPNGIKAFCVPMLFFVEIAYGIREPVRILGAPDWLKVPPFYEIDAKVRSEDAAVFNKLTRNEKNRMLQPLLADRFHLKSHLETRELPVYELRVAKSGPKLKEASADEASKSTMGYNGQGRIEAVSRPIVSLLPLLNDQAGRPVVDKTGLTGSYDFTLQYTAAIGAGPDATGPSVFTALEEQLGLKLEPAKESIDVLVIDSIDKPAEN